MRIEGDFEVVSRGDNRVTLRPVGDVKVLDGSIDLGTDKLLKDKVHLTLNVDVSNPRLDVPKDAYSDEELLNTAVTKVWSKRGGISGNVRPKDDDVEVKELFDKLVAARDDEDESNDDLFKSPEAKVQAKEDKEKLEKEGLDKIDNSTETGVPSNKGGVSITGEEKKEAEVRGEAGKRMPLAPFSPKATVVADSKKALEGENKL